MMLKTVNPAGWDLDVAPAALLKFASDGTLRGKDREDLIKRAGRNNIFLPVLDRIKFAADEEYLHLIGLGAYEHWGLNRNGDGFSKQACIDHCHTFVKHAMWYRNHKNKDKRISYGVIKEAMYNPEMHRVELIVGLNREKSAAERNGGFVADRELEKLARGEDLPVSMACSKAGTLIYTDSGFKPIEEIEPGDMVLTHRGRFRAAGNRSISNATEIVRIHPRYSGRQVLEFTPNHEFYVARWEKLPKGTHRDVFPSNAFRRKYRDQLHTFAEWLPCGQLKPGDVMLFPIRKPQENGKLSTKLARLFGYYVAEGSLINGTSYGVTFTCNRDDILPVEIDELVAPGTSVCRNDHSASEKAVSVSVHTRELYELMENHVGRGVRSKRVPTVVWNATNQAKIQFMAAWLNGDGWQDVKGLHWSTCSRSLGLELQNLLASVDIPASVYRIDHTSDLPHGVPRTGDGIEYTVNVSNKYSGIFAGLCKAVLWEMKTEKTTAFITGGYLAIPVGAVEHVHEACKVYNFSVDEDETYTAFGFGVHNCKIAYDVCTSCGNKAHTRDEYCTAATCKAGGCKEHLSQVVKVGKALYHLGVMNPKPTWFDMSLVLRNADHTAFAHGADWLTKSASAYCSGAEVAAAIGLTAPMSVLTCDDSLMGYPLRTRTQIKLAYGLATMEHEPEEFDSLKLAFHPGVQPELPEHVFADRRKVASMLGALADEKIVLPLREFAKLAAAEHLTAAAAARMPGVYSRMTADGSLEPAILRNRFAPENPVSSYQPTKAAALRAKYSLNFQDVTDRVMLAGMRELNNVICEKTASHSEEGETLAREYAVYKVAALERIAEYDDEFMLTVRLSDCQNRVI